MADAAVQHLEVAGPVRRDRVEEGDQAARANDVDGAAKDLWREGGADERSVPTVGTPVDRHTVGIRGAALDGPPHRVHEIVVHLAAPLAVACVQELLPVTAGPTEVDLKTGVSAVREPLRLGVVAPHVAVPRTAMDVEHHRQVCAGAAGRNGEIAVDREAVP